MYHYYYVEYRIINKGRLVENVKKSFASERSLTELQIKDLILEQNGLTDSRLDFEMSTPKSLTEDQYNLLYI